MNGKLANGKVFSSTDTPHDWVMLLKVTSPGTAFEESVPAFRVNVNPNMATAA